MPKAGNDGASGMERGKALNEERVFRLAKPVRSGLLHLIFSRFLVILLLLALQVGLLVVFYGWLEEYIPYFTVTIGIFTVVMVIYLFNIPMDTSGKLTWMFLISILPLPGALLLLFTQKNAGHRRIQKRVAELIEETKTAIPQDSTVTDRLSGDGSGTDDLARYLSRSGCYPIYDNTDVVYCPQGEDVFEALLTELEKAEHFIFMEFFILEEGYMWGKVLEILTRKAREGVDVRVMYDGMCEMRQLPVNYTRLLRAQGIRAKAFSPIRPVVSSHYNYRDHRKILVVDGRMAFTGGVNLADEYINRVERFGHWKDTGVILRGPAVRSFTLMFLQMWNIGESAPEFEPFLSGCPAPAVRPNGYVIPYGDCPLDGDRVGETVYMDILYRATDYVHIMTPYLILDGELETALCYAAERGVDVKLILPGIPDKKLAYALAKSHYARLLASGVEIWEYAPGFIHAKSFVSDDKKAVVGTINLDYRSLYHHFECAAYLYECDCIPAVERDFQETLTRCRAVTFETIRGEKAFYKIVGTLMKFIAPLM